MDIETQPTIISTACYQKGREIKKRKPTMLGKHLSNDFNLFKVTMIIYPRLPKN